MEYLFFYSSLIGALIALIIVARYKPLDFRSYIIGVTTIAYSLIFDIVFGSHLGLYYYLNPEDSTIYIVMSAILLYPALNIIYTHFLPREVKSALGYTTVWIVAMLIFEYLSIVLNTIVFTGWRPIPWSLVTYFATYLWVYLLYRYLSSRRLVIKLS